MKYNLFFLELLIGLHKIDICSHSLLSLFHIDYLKSHKEMQFFCNLHFWKHIRPPTQFPPKEQQKWWRIRNQCMIYFQLLHSLSFSPPFLLYNLGHFPYIYISLLIYLAVIDLAFLRIYPPYIYSLKLFIIYNFR